MTRALKVALAVAVATCGACDKTVALTAPCAIAKPDTIWFAFADGSKTIAATMRCP